MSVLYRPFDEITLCDMALRLLAATVCGALIGFGRSRRDRNAGLRTYLLVCVGSAAATMISLYDYEMLKTAWSAVARSADAKFDASRIASLAVTGIGFCGAGLIVKISTYEVHGLTTATGLFSTVCLGIAAGLGFYECVFPAMIAIVMVLNTLSPLEGAYKRRLRTCTLNVEFESVSDINEIVDRLEEINVTVRDVDVDPTENSENDLATAIFTLQLPRDNYSHSSIMTTVAEMKCVYSVQELVA